MYGQAFGIRARPYTLCICELAWCTVADGPLTLATAWVWCSEYGGGGVSVDSS